MEVKIEKGIPLPERKKGQRSPKYPLRALEVGDSFFAPIKPAALATHARRESKATGAKFVVRAEDKGSRVWRKE